TPAKGDGERMSRLKITGGDGSEAEKNLVSDDTWHLAWGCIKKSDGPLLSLALKLTGLANFKVMLIWNKDFTLGAAYEFFNVAVPLLVGSSPTEVWKDPC
ncbi:MAG: hypothetical protein PVG44_18340, partial [Desulfobacterales bacterium]